MLTDQVSIFRSGFSLTIVEHGHNLPALTTFKLLHTVLQSIHAKRHWHHLAQVAQYGFPIHSGPDHGRPSLSDSERLGRVQLLGSLQTSPTSTSLRHLLEALPGHFPWQF